MLTRTVAPAFAAAASAAVTGSLLWAPAVSAQTPGPSPSTSVPTQDSSAEAETGGVRILKKDPGGDLMAGAAFTLLDTTGEVAGKGATDARGLLAFDDLAPGVYRLKETSSGSPLHTTVPDRDVVITPGITIPLTVVDPFKPATVLLKTTDDKTGRLLAGSTVNIGSGTTTLLTLTTKANGTATATLPVNSRTGETFWVRQTKAPAGYDLYKPSRTFTAGPGAPVTVTVTNTKTSTGASPAPDPSPGKPDGNESSTPSSSGSRPGSDTTSPVTDNPESSSTSPAPGTEGALAHTGANTTPWLTAGGALLLATGTVAVIAARRRRTANAGDGPTEG
ncbi:SpaA isopeptide-forming pilin-related protein [Streptomyces sp. IB2014 016-6]|uniref:MSCRAMM family protein n=1 Tax=Streptomyces sp. IB2014 016-6 TaxID=2517818 RepID=UPI0011C7552D|nr:SpaA isopeptide-forming pilin-related protein [Streptomyces sp. IB2014 016-6]TXL83929.1 LPXTG cell wall anchor domain-containing protein [Streptomyces sp. IB2014 016-6]